MKARKTKARKAVATTKASTRKGATAKASKPAKRPKKDANFDAPVKRKKAAKKRVGRPRKNADATA